MPLAGILIAALALRIISLNQSLWLDEATTALAAKMSLRDLFGKFLPGDFHPPLHYFLMKYWVGVFGSSEISLRVPSVIFGVGLVYVTYLIGRKVFNKKTALTASALLATSGLSIYYSQEARMYGMAAFLVALAFYLYLEKKWLWFSIVLVTIGMTDYLSLFILPVFLLADIKSRKKLLTSFVPMIGVFALWLPTFIKQISGGIGVKGTPWWNILGLPTLKNIVLIPIKFTLGRISFDNRVVYVLVAITTCGIFAFFLIKTFKLKRIIWMWLTLPIFLGLLVGLWLPIFYYFRFLFCLPALYLLVAAGVHKMERLGWKLLPLLLLINISSTSFYLLDTKFQREDWRNAAATIGSGQIVFPGRSHTEALIYYGKANQILPLDNVSGQDEIWLSRYVWEISDPTDATRHKIESLGYTKSGEYNFNGVVFWKYTMNLFAQNI